MTMRYVTTTIAALLLLAAPAFAQHHGRYGVTGMAPTYSPCQPHEDPFDIKPGVHLPVTATPAVQNLINQGLTLFYSFNYDHAFIKFVKATQLDGGNVAMAHWGVALAAGSNINIGMDDICRSRAISAITRAGELAERQHGTRSITEPEYQYIQALKPRYLGTIKANIPLEAEYKVAMDRLIALYPDDPNALTLYADSVMELRAWGLYDVASRPAIGTEPMVAQLERGIRADARHLGANHYYIHAVEPSLTPERARTAADILPSLFPEGGHIQHMPGHIYMRQGLYPKVIEANLAAIAADKRYLAFCEGGGGQSNPKCLGLYTGHYLSHNYLFLIAGYTMLGQAADAITNADALRSLSQAFVGNQPGLERYMTASIFTRATFQRWQELRQQPKPPEKNRLATGVWHWGQGMAFAALGNVTQAEDQYTTLTQIIGDVSGYTWGNNGAGSLMRIAQQTLGARMATTRGQLPAAIENLKVATTLEDGLIYDEPPPWMYPARQSLGGALLAAKRYAEAETYFREDLGKERYPDNGRSNYGLAISLKCQGKPGWQEYMDRYKARWKGAPLTVGDLWSPLAEACAKE